MNLKRNKKWLLGLLALIFAGMQFIPVKRNQDSRETPADFIRMYPMP